MLSIGSLRGTKLPAPPAITIHLALIETPKDVVIFQQSSSIFSIKFYLIDGFGVDWIIELRNLLLKKFNKKDFKILVDCRNNYGLFINLVKEKIDFLRVNADLTTMSRLKNIAKINKVTVNPEISIINLSNIKNIKSKIQKKLI